MSDGSHLIWQKPAPPAPWAWPQPARRWCAPIFPSRLFMPSRTRFRFLARREGLKGSSRHGFAAARMGSAVAVAPGRGSAATPTGRAQFALFELEVALGQRRSPAGGERHGIAQHAREIVLAGVGR